MLIIEEILGYFLIGIIIMLILAVCYLPFYFILRKKIPLARQITYFLFGACVFVICSATFLEWIVMSLLDGRAILVEEHSLNLIPFQFIFTTWKMEAREQITQTIANIIMFLPLGFIFPVTFKKARSFRKTFVCMMCFSFFIEFVQFFIGRSADIDDLMLNTLGGALGYFIFYLFQSCSKRKKYGKN